VRYFDQGNSSGYKHIDLGDVHACTHHLSTSKVSEHPPIHHPLDACYDSSCG
jgi:hypothetical protein